MSCPAGEAVGNGFYSGEVCIGTTPVSGGFEMTDPARPGLSCTDNGTGFPPGEPFFQTDNTWGNGEPTDLETACVDAMYAAGEEWDMLGDWLGRNGMDGQGHAAPIRVGIGGQVAMFSTEPSPNVLLGQAGHSPTFPPQPDPLGRQRSSMDIVAHEFGHLVFLTTPGGSPSRDDIEMRALEEGTSDIFAQLTIAFANNPKVPLRYTIGSYFDATFRIMYHPSLCRPDGAFCNDPVEHLDCWSQGISESSVVSFEYAAAGPLNHWFYLLAEGTNPVGLPVSPTCDGSTLTGLGIKTAGQIWYNALLQKTPDWTYTEARSATLTAALQLSPDSCTVFDKVEAAWNAVSVPALPDEPTCGATPPTPPPTPSPTTPPTTTPPTTAPSAPQPSVPESRAVPQSVAPPPAVPVSSAVPSSSASSPAASIPFTGIDAGWPLTTGLAAIVLGVPLVTLARRHRRH